MPQLRTKRSAEYEWTENHLYREGFKGDSGWWNTNWLDFFRQLLHFLGPVGMMAGSFFIYPDRCGRRMLMVRWYRGKSPNLSQFGDRIPTLKTSNELGHIGGAEISKWRVFQGYLAQGACEIDQLDSPLQFCVSDPTKTTCGSDELAQLVGAWVGLNA